MIRAVPGIARSRALLPLAAALALPLAACGSAEEEKTVYETDVVDESGGELIVTEETPAVKVDTPDTAMTPVPAGEEAPAAEAKPAPAAQ